MNSIISSLSFCLLVVLLAHNVESNERAKRLIAGSLPQEGELKYQVSIQAKGKHICGGTIIGEQHVLTAASCVMKPRTQKFRTDLKISVVAGLFDLWDLREGGMSATVVKAFVPKTYNEKILVLIGDIAVLKVSKKFEFGPGSLLAPVNLPAPTQLINNGQNVVEYTGAAVVSGYGYDESEIEQKTVNGALSINDKGKSSGKLHKANVEIVDYANCRNVLYSVVFETMQICGRVREHPADVRQGICKHDNGGPLVQGNTIIGIVSFSRLGCDERVYPAIYTRVSAYLNFIQNAMLDKADSNTLVNTWA